MRVIGAAPSLTQGPFAGFQSARVAMSQPGLERTPLPQLMPTGYGPSATRAPLFFEVLASFVARLAVEHFPVRSTSLLPLTFLVAVFFLGSADAGPSIFCSTTLGSGWP